MKSLKKCDKLTKVNTRKSAINIFQKQHNSLNSRHLTYSLEQKGAKRKNTQILYKKNSINQTQLFIPFKQNLLNIKANNIRTTLLKGIDAEKTIGICKINSLTPNQLSACFESFEVTIENPVEIGTPTTFFSQNSFQSAENFRGGIMLEDNNKIDYSSFVNRLRKKKTISMWKFHNYVESFIGFKKKPQNDVYNNNNNHNKKDSKYDLMLKGCEWLHAYALSMKKAKKKKSKRKQMSNENINSIYDSPHSCFLIKRRSNDYDKSPSESDDEDDDNNTEHIIQRYSYGDHTTINKNSNISKANTSLGFTNVKESKFRSYKSVSSHYHPENGVSTNNTTLKTTGNEGEDLCRGYSNDQGVQNDIHHDHEEIERVIILHQDEESEYNPTTTTESKQSCPQYKYESIAMLQSTYGKTK